MLIADLPSLLVFLNNGECHRVCIVDNNLTEKLVMVKDSIFYEKIFAHYDLLLIPEWVYVEICDGDGRKRYIDGLLNDNYINCFIIAEKDYTLLCDYKELELYYIVLNCCKEIASIHSYIRKNVLDPKLAYTEIAVEMRAYEEWITDMYNSNEAFQQEITNNGRIKRKNAGEISICILAAILSIYFDKLECVTIFSYDQDTYKIVDRYKEGIAKEPRFARYTHKPITFKSNNLLLHEWISEGYINLDNILVFMAYMRGTQRVKFTRKLQDGSIEEQYKVSSNEEFIELLAENVHIIY